MDPNPTASRFQTTSWTMIAQAKSNPADFEALLARYWSPVYAWLRRRGHAFEAAMDLTQSFICEIVIQRDLIARADPARGSFRAFLLSALRHFEIDEHRRARGRNGSRARTVIPDDPAALGAAEPSVDDDPARAFERQWAATVFSEALRRTEAACRENGMADHWRAYQARYLQPAMHGTEPASIDDLVGELGAERPIDVSSMIHTAKRKLRVILREVVAETLDDPANVDRELASLRQFLVM